PDLLADPVELLAMRLLVLDHGPRLLAVQPDAPQPQAVGRPALVPRRRRIEDVARGDDGVGLERPEVASRLRGRRRGERLGRRGAAGGGREAEADAVRSQGDGERSEADLEREPKTARGEHGKASGSYCTRPSLARGRTQRTADELLEDDLDAAVLRPPPPPRVARARGGAARAGRGGGVPRGAVPSPP